MIIQAMKYLKCYPSGERIALVEELASGGEGVVWESDRPGILAKVYKQKPNPLQILKLSYSQFVVLKSDAKIT